MFELILQTIVNALVASSATALMAVGLVLIFGVMRVINFAHGELFMVGAYAVWYLYAQNGWPFMAAIAAALVVVLLIGLVMERFLFRPMRGNPLGGLIMSVGVLFILQVVAVEFGGVGLMKHVPSAVRGTVDLFGTGVLVPWQRVVVIGVSAVLLILLWLFLHRTKVGFALRACAQDPEAAALQGISINKFSLIAMGLGAGLAGAAGGVMAPLVRVDPYMGHSVIVTAFIVIIVGGVGSLEGAVLAAVLYTFFHTFVTTFYDGTIATILGLLIMLLVLIVKPTGIMGTSEKV
ncbi:branched-chain amino acid ABC transporter permease [Rhodospirillaceae bacterium SYSU D60014]|uniref:branched-chain amino acid ABC transporter permease n=1 Tax=Virgifigura deserti TaxID=2268457 RepID=UPI000E6667C3